MSDYEILNKELYEKIRSVLYKAYSIVQPLIGLEIIEEYLRKTKQDYYHIHRYLKYSYSFFFQQFEYLIEKCEPEIKNSKEYRDYIEIISKDRVISQHNNFVGMLGGYQKFDEWDIVYSFLYDILISYYKTKKFDETLFDQLYYGLEYYFYNKNIPVIIIAPLINFESQEEEITLDNKLKIRKISDIERSDFFSHLGRDSLSSFDVSLFNYVIELKTTEIKFIYNKENEAKIMKENNEYKKNYDYNITIIKKVLYCLRLFTKGAVGFSFIKYTDVILVPGGITRNLSKGPYRSFGEQYILKKEDIEKLLLLLNLLKEINIGSNKSLSLALNRFNSAYAEFNVENKILNLAISYEILFSKEDDSLDSVTHKLALRFSRLYSEDIDERICVFRKMKKLYNTRSNIVHGKKEKSEYLSAIEFEEFMRISFKKYIEKVHNKYTHNQIIEQLDFE